MAISAQFCMNFLAWHLVIMGLIEKNGMGKANPPAISVRQPAEA
jgi:hypothetical protein